MPAVYGHEASGRVAEVGAGVTDLAVGNRVVVTLIRSCGMCRFCRRGLSVSCETRFGSDESGPIRDGSGREINQSMGTGAFAEQVVVHRSQVVAIDDDVPFDAAALLGCGVITGVGAVNNTAGVEPVSQVVVIGTGGVGLNAVQGAALAGARTVVAVDVSDYKLDAARSLGATHAVNAGSDGTVALDLVTGALDWGFQAFPHDIFDRDHVLTALGDARIDGADRTVLITAGKGGLVIALDPASGERLWSTPIGRHQNDEVTRFEAPLEVFPGAQGGIVTPIAVADGVAFVAAINAPLVYASDEVNSSGAGTELFRFPSNVAAIDVSNGSILWDIEIAGDVLGAMTVVNDLLFTSTISGEILALDSATGEVVWDHQAEGGINGWPAVAGDLVVFPVGFANPPHLLAFRLRD